MKIHPPVLTVLTRKSENLQKTGFFNIRKKHTFGLFLVKNAQNSL